MRSAEKRRSAARRQAARSKRVGALGRAATAESTSCREDAGDAVLDELRHRPAGVGDDRRAAEHRLDDREAERLGERDRVQEAARPPRGPRRAPRGPTEPRYADAVAVDVRLDLLGEVALVLDGAAEHERRARRGGRSRSPAPCPCRGGCGRSRRARRRRWPRTAARRCRRRDGRRDVRRAPGARSASEIETKALARTRGRRAGSAGDGEPVDRRHHRRRGRAPRRPAAASRGGCGSGRSPPSG